MAIEITSELYNTNQPALYANAGSWNTVRFGFSNVFRAGSGDSNVFSVQANKITASNASFNFADSGFSPGLVTITFKNVTNGFLATITRTIDYINGNKLFFTSNLFAGIGNFPGQYSEAGTVVTVSGMLLVQDKSPQSAEFKMNLAPTGSGSLASVIDGNENKFTVDNLDALGVTDDAIMVQMGNRSGGHFQSVVIERGLNTTEINDFGGGDTYSYTVRNYMITAQFIQWGIVQDGNTPMLPPSYYDSTACLNPIIEITSVPVFGNPNGRQSATNGSDQGNTGYFNENYNGGQNDFSLNNIQWQDLNGIGIESMDYSNPCRFTATINAPAQNTINSRFRIGMFWSPADATAYRNKPLRVGENLISNIPNVSFAHSVTPDPTIWQGMTNDQGVRFDLSDLQFLISGTTVLVQGKVTPNAAAKPFFDAIEEGNKTFEMFVQLDNYTLDFNSSNRVNLTIFKDEIIDAPTLGIVYPYIESAVLLDHYGTDITDAISATNVTTEDDVRWLVDLKLQDGEQYEGIRARIFGLNDITGENFTLEDFFFDFENFPFINGRHEVNSTINRNFPLPSSTDRNTISLNRNPLIDGSGFYGMTLDYGFLIGNEYWQSETQVDDFFFDSNEPNNGKNNQWTRFTNGDWQVYVGLYVRKNDVDDYFFNLLRIADYDQTPNVSTSVTLSRPDGTTVTNFPENELITVTVAFDWNFQFLPPVWVEFSIWNRESNLISIASSILDIDPGNIWKPIPGETKIQVVGENTTQITAKMILDTSMFGSDEVSLSCRIYSMQGKEGGNKLMEDGTPKLTEDSIFKNIE